MNLRGVRCRFEVDAKLIAQMFRPSRCPDVAGERGRHHEVFFGSCHRHVQQAIRFILLALVILFFDGTIGRVFFRVTGLSGRPTRPDSLLGMIERVLSVSRSGAMQRRQDNDRKFETLRGVHRHHFHGVEILLSKGGFRFVERGLLQLIQPRDQLIKTKTAAFRQPPNHTQQLADVRNLEIPAIRFRRIGFEPRPADESRNKHMRRNVVALLAESTKALTRSDDLR